MHPSHIELFFNYITKNSLTLPYNEKIEILHKYTVYAKQNAIIEDELYEIQVFAKFLEKPNQIFCLCEDFSKDLYDINLNIPSNVIPDLSECVLIEFPDWFKAQNSDGFFIRSVYVYQDKIMNGTYNKLCRTLRLQFPDYLEDGSITGSTSFLWINLENEINMAETVELIQADQSIVQINKNAVMFALKAYIYLHSGEPDLRAMKSIEIPKTQKEKKLRHFIRNNAGLFFDFTYLGYFYKKQRFYNVDGIEVKGHMRWQRYGAGNMKLKYIWINPFTKTNLKHREDILP